MRCEVLPHDHLVRRVDSFESTRLASTEQKYATNKIAELAGELIGWKRMTAGSWSRYWRDAPLCTFLGRSSSSTLIQSPEVRSRAPTRGLPWATASGWGRTVG